MAELMAVPTCTNTISGHCNVMMPFYDDTSQKKEAKKVTYVNEFQISAVTLKLVKAHFQCLSTGNINAHTFVHVGSRRVLLAYPPILESPTPPGHALMKSGSA